MIARSAACLAAARHATRQLLPPPLAPRSMAAAGEWLLAWWVFSDEAGLLHRGDFRGQFDGSAYYKRAQRGGVRYFPRVESEGRKKLA